MVLNSLKMGWDEIPPFFCSSIETARDVVAKLIDIWKPLPPHPFEHILLQQMQQHSTQPSASTPFVTIIEFFRRFIDATNNHNIYHLPHVSRCLLHGIHSIFVPPEFTIHLGEDPISKENLSKGDVIWDPIKYILGWIIDGKNYTIQLTPKKANEIFKMIRSILKQQKLSLNKSQKIVGKLQYASFGIPGGQGLFSPIHQ